MIKTFTVIKDTGESIVIDLRSPEKSGFFIKKIDGLGPCKSDINTTEVLSADGSFYNSSRITPRNLVLNLGFYNYDVESIETIRQRTYRFFPMKKLLTFEIETDNRIGITEGYVETNEPDIFSKEESASISIVCPSAFFYGKNIIQSFFNTVQAGFEFPFENASLTEKLIEFGTVFISNQKSIVYTGDEETGMTIYMTFIGTTSGITITNTQTGEVFIIDSTKLAAIVGSGISAGDEIIISTHHGYKFIYLIRNTVTYNILNAVAAQSSWLRLVRGDNVFVYTASVGQTNMQVVIEHRLVYSGV